MSMTAWHNDPISPERADSMEELARMAGVTVGTVTSSISRRKRAKRPGRSKYQVVWVPRGEV